MDKQKILDKLAVIRENVKTVSSIPEDLNDIESEIMSLMNEISEEGLMEEINEATGKVLQNVLISKVKELEEPKPLKLFLDYGVWKHLDDQTKDNIIKGLTKEIETLEEKFKKLMKLSDDYYKNDRKVIYDYANKIEALEEKISKCQKEMSHKIGNLERNIRKIEAGFK